MPGDTLRFFITLQTQDINFSHMSLRQLQWLRVSVDWNVWLVTAPVWTPDMVLNTFGRCQCFHTSLFCLLLSAEKWEMNHWYQLEGSHVEPQTQPPLLEMDCFFFFPFLHLAPLSVSEMEKWSEIHAVQWFYYLLFYNKPAFSILGGDSDPDWTLHSPDIHFIWWFISLTHQSLCCALVAEEQPWGS